MRTMVALGPDIAVRSADARTRTIGCTVSVKKPAGVAMTFVATRSPTTGTAAEQAAITASTPRNRAKGPWRHRTARRSADSAPPRCARRGRMRCGVQAGQDALAMDVHL